MSVNPNMANREVADLVLLNYSDKKVFLNIDFANVTTTELSSERVYAKGGRGAPNRVGFDGERTGTLQVSTQIMPAKLFSLMSGADIATTCTSLKRESVTAGEGGSVTLADTPKEGSVQVFLASDEGGAEVEAAQVSGTTISGLTASTNYVVYYFAERASGVQAIKFNADTFPKAFEIHGSMPFKTENDEIVECELVYYKAQPQPSFSLSFQNTGDPTQIDLTFDLFANGDGDIYDMNFITG